MDDVDRLLPESDGLLARIVASTDDGVVLLQLWESADARDRNANDPAHAEALAASGIFAATRGTRGRVFDDAELPLPPLIGHIDGSGIFTPSRRRWRTWSR